MKLGIVIPLKSRAASRDWNVTCESLKATLKSVYSQTSRNFESIVVGHEKPALRWWETGTVTFHRIEIDPLGRDKDAFSQADYTLDKNRKIVRGMQLLKSRGITHWYALDADDLMHCDFVKQIGRMDLLSGCILDAGHVIYRNCNRAVAHQDLSILCGSTSILTDNCIHIPETLSPEDMDQVPWCRYAHMHMDRYFERELGGNYLRIRLPLVGYVIGHGDNCSDGYRTGVVDQIKARLKPYILGRPLSEELIQTYSL